MIESLLLATDFSPRSELALDRALLLANGAADRIGVLHVIDREVSTALVRGENSEMPPVIDDLLDARLAPEAPRPAILIRKGDPFEEILDAADDRDDDLIVMGTPRPRRFFESLRGTTLERVIRASTRSVLSVRSKTRGPYRNVLIATDMSDTSALAIETAYRLGLLAKARVTVVHALWPPVPHMVAHSAMTIDGMQKQIAAEKSGTKKELHAFLEGMELGSLKIESRVVEGTPQMVVRDCVAELLPDLVVLGTRGRSGVLRFVLGSVAEDLLSWLPVDVLAVPPEDDL